MYASHYGIFYKYPIYKYKQAKYKYPTYFKVRHSNMGQVTSLFYLEHDAAVFVSGAPQHGAHDGVGVLRAALLRAQYQPAQQLRHAETGVRLPSIHLCII